MQEAIRQHLETNQYTVVEEPQTEISPTSAMTQVSPKVDKICKQIFALEDAEKSQVLKRLWQLDQLLSGKTPKLAIDVKKCVRLENWIQVEIELTNIALEPFIITGFNYFLDDQMGEGTCYCYCLPGETQSLAFGLQHIAASKTTIALTGFNPHNGIPIDGGKVIHGFVAEIKKA